MAKTPEKPMKRVHLWLYAEDVDRLHLMFDSNIGFSKAARAIVHKYLNILEAQALARAGSTTPQLSGDELESMEAPAE